MPEEAADPADLPDAPGAYVLAVDLRRPLRLSLKGRQPVDLEPGRYLYAGSARGPGGIRARVGRHVKTAKSVRWHIDRLTNAAGVAQVLAQPGGDECALLADILALPGAAVPVPGFGASDCARCPAHLAAVDAGCDLAALAPRRAGAVLWRRPPVRSS
jgi:Uri superfamily endonuclease